MKCSTEVVLEPLEGVSNKRQRHLGRLVLFWIRLQCPGVRVIDVHGVGGLGLQLLGGKVRRIDLGRETRLEGGPESPEIVKVDTCKEGVLLDLVGPEASESGFRVADQTK